MKKRWEFFSEDDLRCKGTGEINMNEEHLNLEIRKFLKKVGITSQRIVEYHIKKAIESGSLKIGESIDIEMKLTEIGI